MVEFSGAAGTLASPGKDGLAVQSELAKELELAVPNITWHCVRDSLAETINLLAMIGGSLAKIAMDVSIMMTTEIGEVSEPYAHHRGASSTMPQKQNPVSCELIIASSKIVRQHAGLMLDAMVHDFERATGPWHLEWAAIPESFSHTASMLSGLRVYPQNMKSNLDHSGGLIVAEAVMMALAPKLGRVISHDLVYDGCRQAIEQKKSLFEVLKQNQKIVDELGLAELERLTDPVHYLGSAGLMVDRVLAGQDDGG